MTNGSEPIRERGAPPAHDTDAPARARRSFFWPAIVDLDSAIAATRYGRAAAILCALLALVVLVLRLGAGDRWSDLPPAEPAVYALVYAAAALGIHKRSRIAAVLALVLYFSDLALTVADGNGAGILIKLVIAIAFVNGLRGTLAYHRFRRHARTVPAGDQLS